MKKLIGIVLINVLLFTFTTFLFAQESAKEHLQRGLLYEKSGMLDEAVKEYEKAIALDPNYSDALYNAGILYLRAQKWEDSMRCLERVVMLNPSDGEAYYNLSVAYFGLERYDDAIRAHDKSIELGFSGKVEFRSALEPYRYREIDFEYTPLLTDKKEKIIIKIKGNPLGDKVLIYDTIKDLETFDHHFPKGMFKNVNVEFIKWKEKGNSHIEKWTIIRDDNTQKPYWVEYIPDPQRGTKISIRNKEEEPELGQEELIIEMRRGGALNKGLDYARNGKYDEAINEFTKAIQINPNNAIACYNRGLAYKHKGNLDQAISDYTKAIEINPRYADAYTNRGLAYYDKGDFDQAISDYNKAIEINPNLAGTYFNRGLIYLKEGNLDEAISNFTKAIELNPNFAVAYNNRAAVYFVKQDYDKSWEDLHKAESLGYQIDPELLEKLKKASGRER